MEGDEDLLYSLLRIFIATAPDLIKGMHQTIHMENRSELQRLAHQIKGSLSAVHARHEGEQAEQLERMAVSATFSHLHSTLFEFEQMVKQLIGVFQRLISFQRDKEGGTSQGMFLREGRTGNDHAS
jgi:HPt (histidine-containing phosphotransfer) domain-containing protein